MSQLIEPVARLIESFSRLPGIGPKTAQRLTYHLLRAPDTEARTLAAALVSVRDDVVFCERCFERIEGNWIDLKPHGVVHTMTECHESFDEKPKDEPSLVAAIQLEGILAEINKIWMDRENLTPEHTPRKRLVAMEVYQLLPQTNCRLCSEPSCFAFASRITVGEADAEACTPLFEEEPYADKRQALLDMLAEAAR